MIPEPVAEAMGYLRHDLTQAHGESHPVDAEALAVVLEYLEAQKAAQE